MVGKVVSIKMNKTAVVLVESLKSHSLYKKSFLRTKKYLADDQIGVKEGDVVEIVGIRPISKRKHWQVVKILGKDLEMLAKKELKEVAAEAIAEVLPENEIEKSSDVSRQNEETKEEKPKVKRKRKEQSDS